MTDDLDEALTGSPLRVYGRLQNENQAYAHLLCGHLQEMVHRLRQLTPVQWDWAPAPPAPTARILGVHAWQWLSVTGSTGEPDARRHAPVPDPPADPDALCDALAEETERWRALILGLTPEQFAQERHQFNGCEKNVRDFVCHMIQNSIYKHRQFATLLFALGLDGDAPYDAPFPNRIYANMHEAENHATP